MDVTFINNMYIVYILHYYIYTLLRTLGNTQPWPAKVALTSYEGPQFNIHVPVFLNMIELLNRPT